MQRKFEIDDGLIAEQNSKLESWIHEDYEHLAKVLRRRQIDIEDLVSKAQSFRVAVPSWGLGTGGTRFARFPGPGEPRDIYEKLEDGAEIMWAEHENKTLKKIRSWKKTKGQVRQ